ncbi:glycosyltransferase involved in cell wall biosynthesis [Polymorphobacter multimanifer]|uniref:Glycosyltransferase involved in cell wall biosynthesis n=1 Tax=Polymorphobacter multimanifer TaxID=1070431 RepID=A0A841L4N9_9SPHN|nr:glycosyltransferase involved in cell wall biosynthesis [Polymorphobacter multimanifer]
MRVLTFLHAFGPGGVERDALRLLQALTAAGPSEQAMDVPLVMGRLTGPMADDARGLEVHALDGASDRTAGYETLWMIAKLPAQIRALRPDVLFCPGNAYAVVAAAMRLWLGRRCPPIVIKISNDLERRDLPVPVRWGYHLWVRLQMRLFDAVIAMAPAAVEEISRIGRIAPDRITMIPNPCFSEAELGRLAATAAARRPAAQGTRFLCIGRLARQKNMANLLRAFADAAGPDDRLTIIGEGGARAALEALAEELGIDARVSMPGHLSDPVPAMAAHDVFVLASDYEGLGVVVLEALAAGLPVVATDCSINMADLLAEGRGLLVPVRDPAALGAAMQVMAARVRAGDGPDPAAMLAMARAFTVEKGLPAHRALFAGTSRHAAS